MVKTLRKTKAALSVAPKKFKREPPASKSVSEAFKFQTIEMSNKKEKLSVGNKLDRSPLRRNFNSKVELEQGDEERLKSYNMYWHLQEFDRLDLDEEMDIDKKFRLKQEHEKLMEKFRSLGESVHIKKFMKYEKTNAMTHLYNKNRKIDSMMKQMN